MAPETPLKGSFNVGPGQELHRRAMVHAKRKDLNLNAVVSGALRSYLDREERQAQSVFRPQISALESRTTDLAARAVGRCSSDLGPPRSCALETKLKYPNHLPEKQNVEGALDLNTAY